MYDRVLGLEKKMKDRLFKNKEKRLFLSPFTIPSRQRFVTLIVKLKKSLKMGRRHFKQKKKKKKKRHF
jgi:hypothetical protein